MVCARSHVREQLVSSNHYCLIISTGRGSETMAYATAVFDEEVQKIIEEWKVPGLAIAVIQGDEIHAKVLSILCLCPKYSLTRLRVTE